MRYPELGSAINLTLHALKHGGKEVDTGHWQGVDTQGKPDLVTREIVGMNIVAPMYLDAETAAISIKPNLPWADDHFAERVSRVPSNPGEEYKNWLWWSGSSAQAETSQTHVQVQDDPKFTHTYQERFWPKDANVLDLDYEPPRKGIRYDYGDLDDVVNLLFDHPYTRQATFPIFFPEDTGAVHGGRIPCTLHYHFLLRGDKLHLFYPIRSCDAVRHFRDDVYLANRLCHWVIDQLVEKELRSDKPQVWVDVEPGDLDFKAYSFHVHMGDYHLL